MFFLIGVILFVPALGLIRHLFGKIAMYISVPIILMGLAIAMVQS